MEDFPSTGWVFPIGVDGRGRIALTRGERDIEESIRLIIMTPPEQRVMRPEFGCKIHSLSSEINDVAISSLAAAYVEEALARWEPRIEVQRVIVNPDREKSGQFIIEVRYTIKSTQERHALTLPFERAVLNKGDADAASDA